MSSPTNPAAKKVEQSRPDAGHVPMTEELDSARWSLPPLVPVLVAAVVLAVVLGTYLLSSRKPPTSSGRAVQVIALPTHIESKGSIAPGAMGTVDQNVETRDAVLVNIALDVPGTAPAPLPTGRAGVEGERVTTGAA